MNLHEISTGQLATELNKRMQDNAIGRIIQVVAEVFKITESQILAYDRSAVPVAARTLAMALAQEHNTLTHVARTFNRLDHTTVIAARHRADAMTRSSAEFREKAMEVVQKLKAIVTG